MTDSSLRQLNLLVTPICLAIAAFASPSFAAESTTEEAPLTPVVVHGARTQQTAGKLSATAEEMSHVPGSLGDPLKALQSLPGVASTNDSSSAPAIRGSRPEDNLYVIDGLPAGNVFHLGGLTSVLHPGLVNRFDLYSAGFGATYSGATGGVIDVKLRKPRTDKIGGQLDLGFLGGDLLLEGPVNESQSFYFAGKRSWLDLVTKTAATGKEPDSDGTIVQMPRYGDYLGKYLWRLSERNEISIHFSGSTDRLSVEVPPDSILAQQQPVLMGNGDFLTDDHTEAVSLHSYFGANITSQLSVGQHTAHTNQKYGSAVSADLVQKDRFVSEQLIVRAGSANELTLGGRFNDLSTNYRVNLRNALCTEFSPDCDYGTATDVATSGHVKSQSSSLYASDRWTVSPEWAATAGVNHSRDGYLRRSVTEPRVELEWKMRPNTLVSVAWGKYSQSPEPEQSAPDIGNPKLDFLRSTHTVVGLSQRLAHGWEWQAEVYRKSTSGLVIGDLTRNFVNGGSGTASGLELLVKKNQVSGDPISGWVSVSWAQSKRRNELTGESFRFAYDQPLIINAVGSYRLPSGWEASAKWTYHTGVPDTAVIGTGTYADGRVRPIYGPINGERLPDYHRLDVRLEKKIRRDLHVYGELINAYNHKNVGGYGYSADYKSRYPILQLGLIPSIGMKADF